MLVVGPGLFPARLRRSSACACAAAAVHRETHHAHRDVESHHVMTKQVYQILSRKQKCSGNSKPIKSKSAISLCALFVLRRNASSREIQRI